MLGSQYNALHTPAAQQPQREQEEQDEGQQQQLLQQQGDGEPQLWEAPVVDSRSISSESHMHVSGASSLLSRPLSCLLSCPNPYPLFTC